MGGHFSPVLHHLLVADNVRLACAGGDVREGDCETEGSPVQVGEQQGAELGEEEEGGGQAAVSDGEVAGRGAEAQVRNISKDSQAESLRN